jgi:hypothetical protein
MLYTAALSVYEKAERKMKSYYIMPDLGNDAVVPDKSDLNQYSNEAMSWEGLKVSYLAKLMKPEAEEWMKRVSFEAVGEDVALISDEEDVKNCYRLLLAVMMMNMFSGQTELSYAGELQ